MPTNPPNGYHTVTPFVIVRDSVAFLPSLPMRSEPRSWHASRARTAPSATPRRGSAIPSS